MVQVCNHTFPYGCRSFRAGRFHGCDRPVFVISHPVQGRYIYAFQLRQVLQALFTAQALFLPFQDHPVQFGHDVLAVPDHERVDKIRQRFGIEGAGAAGHDDRIIFSPFPALERDPAHLQHRQDIAVAHLILKRKADDVESIQRVPAFHGKQGQPFFFHQGNHIRPRHEEPLTQAPALPVDQSVQDLQAEMAHPDLIGIRKTEPEMKRTAVPFLHRRVHLSAGISRRLLDFLQRPLKSFVQIHNKALYKS